ncbi:MAG: four helix bundle protein [Elusimicrobiota bacterium]
MSKIEKFEDLFVWQEAKKLVSMIYQLCQKDILKKEFGLTEQIKRSSVSVMANITEGFGRYSFKESKQFYNNARGSLAETQSHLYVIKEISKLNEPDFELVYIQSVKVNKLINGLITNIIKRTR